MTETLQTQISLGQQIADAILAKPSGYDWSLSVVGYPPTSVTAYTGITPETEHTLAAFFGKYAPVTHGGRNIPGPRVGACFVQQLVREGHRMDRVGYHVRRRKIALASGMAGSGPTHVLRTIWDCPRPKGGTWAERVPHIAGNYLNVTVERFADRTMLLSCQELTGDEATIAELYVWRGCEHTHEVETSRNCYRKYRCSKCGDTYEIDSSD